MKNLYLIQNLQSEAEGGFIEISPTSHRLYYEQQYNPYIQFTGFKFFDKCIHIGNVSCK